MKIAVFSDIHGNYHALKAIINDIKRNKIKDIVFLGDAIGFGPNSKECLNLLLKENVKYTLGNHELYYIFGNDIDKDISDIKLEHNNWIHEEIGNKYKDELKSQHMRIKLKIKDKTFSFIHFFMLNETYPFYHLDIFNSDKYREVFETETSDYVFFGHRHTDEQFEHNNTKYICVGSSGCVTNSKTYYYIIDINKEINITKKEIPFNRKKFENIIKRIDFPDKKNICNKFFGI